MAHKRKQTSERSATRASAPSAQAPSKGQTQAATQGAPQLESVGEQSRSVSYEEVARLAFSYWEQRGYQNGSPDADWLRAEQELLSMRP